MFERTGIHIVWEDKQITIVAQIWKTFSIPLCVIQVVFIWRLDKHNNVINLLCIMFAATAGIGYKRNKRRNRDTLIDNVEDSSFPIFAILK